MKWYILIIFTLLSSYCFSQAELNGIVKDKKGEPVFAANIYLKNAPQKGVVANFDGNFSLHVLDLTDTLIVSFIGYETARISLSTLNINEPLVIILNENTQTLAEIIITAQDPISEQFSVVKMKKLDVYLNPVSQGDPLRAITTLPASTTTDETANPSLRGSSADRSRVVLNGVPIYNPVRASQLNNQGFFSLFNPEIIDKMYVYASNPPLTYGNTSAGLVEIQTVRNLESNQLQLSASLASVGFFLSQKIKKDVSFIQLYGNYQFSEAFTGIQKDNLPNIKKFNTQDAGLNFYHKISKKAEFNSYNYYINENFNGLDEQFTYKGDVFTENKRFFTVNNLKYYTSNGVLSVNSGTNTSKQNFSFGSVKSENRINQVFSSIDYKWRLLEATNLQFGISHDFHQNKFKDSIPIYFYALSPTSPSNFSETSISNHILEAYLYTNWDINDRFTFSSGMRSNMPTNSQKYYFSSQLGLKYRLSNKQSFLLSGGKYHNYSIPNFFSKSYNLLSSYQVALDYTYEFKNTTLKSAIYFKNETGNQSVNSFFIMDKENTLGVEMFIEQNFLKYYKFTFANSFINQVITIDGENYKGDNDFDYLIKATLQFNNPKLFSIALTYVTRPGTYFNPIIGSTFDNNTNFYEPTFSNDLFSLQYKNYNRLDLSLSKYIKFKKNALITFVSLNNVVNRKNEREVLYNANYLSNRFDYFQLRIIYFGVVWQVNY